MLKRLFLLTLITLSMQRMQAMACTKNNNTIDLETLYARLPKHLVKHIASFFTTRAWRNRFYEWGATYTVPVNPDSNIMSVSACGHEFLTTVHKDRASELHIYAIDTGARTEILQLGAGTAALSHQYIALCDHEYCVYVYDRTNKTCTELIDLAGKAGDKLPLVKISLDEKYIAIGTADSTVFIFQRQDKGWEQVHRQQQSTQTTRCSIEDIQFSKDSSLMLSLCEDNNISVWDVKAGTVQQTFIVPETMNAIGTQLYGLINNCVITDDNRTVAASREYWLRPIIWDVATGKQLKTEDQHKFCGAAGAYYVATDLTAKHITSHHESGKKQIVWDTESGECIAQIPTKCALKSPIKTTCASSDKDTIRFIISHDYKTMIIRMSVDSVNKLLQKLSFEELLLIDYLIKVHMYIKNVTTQPALSSEQLKLFRKLPLFVQTAFTKNMTMRTPHVEKSHDAGDQKGH